MDTAGQDKCTCRSFFTSTLRAPAAVFSARVLSIIARLADFQSEISPNRVQGADVVIYDSTYTEEEFPERIGWGHSTWNEGVRLCKAANVKKLAIFHHEPEHTDEIMDEIARASKAEWDQSFVCREGMELTI